MPLVEAAFRRAEEAARDEWHATGGDFGATLRAGIKTYLSDAEVNVAASDAVASVSAAREILQAIGAKEAP